MIFSLFLLWLTITLGVCHIRWNMGIRLGFHFSLFYELYTLATAIPFICFGTSFLIQEICPELVRRFISADFNFCTWDLITGIFLFSMGLIFVILGLSNLRAVGLAGFTNQLGFFNSIGYLLSRLTLLRNPLFSAFLTLLGGGLITGLVPDYFNSTIKGDCEATNSSPLMAFFLVIGNFFFGAIIVYLFSFLVGVDITFK